MKVNQITERRAASKKNDDDDMMYTKSCAEALKPIEETLQSTYASTKHRAILTPAR